MTPQELKMAVASGLDAGSIRAGICEGLRALSSEVKGFAEALDATADELERGSDEGGAALQIAIARRVFEEANAEAGDLFDVATWSAGVASSAEAEAEADAEEGS